MAVLLKGKPIADKIKEDLKEKLSSLKRPPLLASIQIGDNAATEVYIKNQTEAAKSLGIHYELKKLDASISQDAAAKVISELNADKNVSGIIIQMPVPGHINFRSLTGLINPEKDAEGMHPVNLGRIVLGDYKIGPCTAMAVMEILASTGVDLYGKNTVIIGHSEIVGKPLAMMLLKKFATVSVCHIATYEHSMLWEYVKKAEVLVVAVGKAGFVKGEFIKDEAIVIDVGINKVGDKITGDIEFETAEKRASFITPVPGGIGPITTTMLMRNVVEICCGKET